MPKSGRASSFPAATASLMLAAVVMAGCHYHIAPSSGMDKDATTVPMAEFWNEPRDLESRDLLHGPGGPGLVPDRKTNYRFKGLDTTGRSRGYDVEDPQGRKWDIKIGNESQTEVVVSRILWAIGYHQPIVYYVPRWHMTDGPTPGGEPGRFRLASDHRSQGTWSWHDNPFVGTKPFKGLVVANLVLNQWDFKTSNNRVYSVENDPRGPSRWFVVQDIGSALGKTAWPVGTRDDVDQFESQVLVLGVEGGIVKFDFHARHRFLLEGITPEDVVWSCRLLSRLSDNQLDDALRAGGYTKRVRERYLRKIKEKIQEGLALEEHGKGRS